MNQWIHKDDRISSRNAETAVTQFQVVKRGSAPEYQVVKTSDATTDIPLGVAAHSADAGAPVAIVESGPCQVIASAAITAGAKIQATADGKVKTAVATGYTIGMAEEDAAADGDIIKATIRISDIPKA